MELNCAVQEHVSTCCVGIAVLFPSATDLITFGSILSSGPFWIGSLILKINLCFRLNPSRLQNSPLKSFSEIIYKPNSKAMLVESTPVHIYILNWFYFTVHFQWCSVSSPNGAACLMLCSACVYVQYAYVSKCLYLIHSEVCNDLKLYFITVHAVAVATRVCLVRVNAFICAWYISLSRSIKYSLSLLEPATQHL